MEDGQTLRRTIYSRISFVHRALRSSPSVRSESATTVDCESFAEEVRTPTDEQVPRCLDVAVRPKPPFYTWRKS